MKHLLLGLLLAASCFGAPADFIGRWTGDVEVSKPDGNTRTHPALIVFKEIDGKLTGTGGPDESRQMPFENLKVDGNKITGEALDGNTKVSVAFTVDGDSLNGEAKVDADGQTMTAKFALKRSKP
jgi:hypothetical protein